MDNESLIKQENIRNSKGRFLKGKVKIILKMLTTPALLRYYFNLAVFK